MLWLRTVLFTILVPGTDSSCSRWSWSSWGPRLVGAGAYSGLVPLLVGLVIILRCFADFVRRGRGTPALYDPPRELVVAGLYRYVRNPQYVGVVLVMVGEALLSGMVVLFGYAALMAIGYHLFVRYYEEPTLGRLFGEPYARYREAVPRWLPRQVSERLSWASHLIKNEDSVAGRAGRPAAVTDPHFGITSWDAAD